MTDEIFIKNMQRRIAQISVGASALRNQGAKGIIDICREYFENSIDLKVFVSSLKSGNHKSYLDKHTSQLLDKFPENGKSWGAARKGLNLFFRDVVYNLYLANHLGIPLNKKANDAILKDLEVPLDKDVAMGITSKCSNLPKWKSIKNLTAKESEKYQSKASEYAKTLDIPKVHIDLEFWRNDTYRSKSSYSS